MNLDFRACKTPEDVKKVFDNHKREIDLINETRKKFSGVIKPELKKCRNPKQNEKGESK